MTTRFDDAVARVRQLPEAQQEAAATLLLDLLRELSTPPAEVVGHGNVPGRYATAAQIDAVFKSLSR